MVPTGKTAPSGFCATAIDAAVSASPSAFVTRNPETFSWSATQPKSSAVGSQSSLPPVVLVPPAPLMLPVLLVPPAPELVAVPVVVPPVVALAVVALAVVLLPVVLPPVVLAEAVVATVALPVVLAPVVETVPPVVAPPTVAVIVLVEGPVVGVPPSSLLSALSEEQEIGPKSVPRTTTADVKLRGVLFFDTTVPCHESLHGDRVDYLRPARSFVAQASGLDIFNVIEAGARGGARDPAPELTVMNL